MISLDIKTETTTSSPLGLSTSEEEPTISFSSLLKGFNPKEANSEGKIIQNGALVLSFADSAKDIKLVPKLESKETLLSLLKSKDTLSEKAIEPLEINPKITENLTIAEIKVLIADAKEYLKDKIMQSDEYKNAQLKDIPKTLKGLAQLAQRVGIDVSKITIEEVQVKPLVKELPKALEKTEIKAQVAVKSEAPLKAEVKQEIKSEAPLKAAVKQEVKAETPLKAEVKQEIKQQIETAVDIKKQDSPKQVELPSKTALFKAQTATEHTTEQLVATKQFKTLEKTPISRADETLKLLLRGEKTLKTDVNLTADFSVATAKVIAPGATSEAAKSLESLLRGDSGDTPDMKIDGATTHKADSFEVKINEAKQMIKYLSADVKTAIEDYKSPFTRVKVQLNPQRLGEVDVTIVQRGKNLHVNISSNNVAINTLSSNANELRVQLNNSGINNATLNFNNSSQGEQQNPSQQQHREQAREEYNHFENEEANEEILSSLEIVVPSYA